MDQASAKLKNRLKSLRWFLPLSFVLLVILYQLGPARLVHDAFSDSAHYGTEILFYATVGPLLTYWALGLVGRWFDEKELAERSARASERRLAAITSASADAILGIDDDGCIELWNRGAELLFGYPAAAMHGKPLSELFAREQAAEVELQWLQDAVLHEGFVRGHEMTYVDASGRRRDVELTATILDEHDGSPAMSVIMRDITQRKRRELEIRRLNASLNEQVAARTQELALKVTELGRANSQLQKLDQTRSEFVSLVSHQIRAPLTNMRGAMERMQGDCRRVNPTCTRMFTILEDQIFRLDRLVQNVLASNRIETDDLPLHCEPLSILPLLRQVVEQNRARSVARHIALPEKPGLPLVLADHERVADVMTNLLDNADKYSPPGEPIEVDVRADDAAVTISVRDHGPGLAGGDLERIFDKFYRTDSSDSQAAYGYGLGLYLCRRLVEAQGGKIWAENHKSGGAVFSFLLPVWGDSDES